MMPFCKLYILFLPFSFILTEINSELFLNDKCTLKKGNQGKCISIEQCPSAIKMIQDGRKPERCGFEGTREIVCCESLDAGEISKQKCLEYTTKSAQPSVKSMAQRISSRSILGGIDALPKEFPYMAALGYEEENNILWFCGASLISEKYVLASAHCVSRSNLKYVRLGDLNLNLDTDDAKPQQFNVSRVIIHPDYKGPSFYNDIALIELSSLVVLDKYVQPVCLQTDFHITESIWSAIDWAIDGDNPTYHLQKVAMRPSSIEECQTVYPVGSNSRRLKNGIEDQTQVCAGELNKDTCQGNSGGPLYVQSDDNPNGHDVVIGVTSFGKPCGIRVPTVYTRVSYYVGWIESIVWPQ